MQIIRILLKIFRKAARVFAIVAVVNLIFSYIEEFVHRHVPEDGQLYLWRHGKIFYHKRGTGNPIILLHGFDPSHSGKDVVSLSKHLASNHTVYSIDLLGFGLSDKPWIVYTNYLYVLLIQDFIRDVIGEVTDIIACEESGLCSLQARKLEPSLIGKIVLVSPCYKEKHLVTGWFGVALKKLIDFPVIGTFIYNLYSLTGAAPFDKEGRHVFTSRLCGYLTSDLSGHEDLITEDVAVLKNSSNSALTYGDIKSSLI